MLFFKLIILFVIFAACVGVGVNISLKYVNRVRELKAMVSALNVFEEKIKFTYAPIPEIFAEIGESFEDSIGKIFAQTSENMKTMFAGEAWEKAVDSVDTNFTSDDLNVIKGLAKMLGKTDLDGQVSEIRLTKEFLNTKINEAEIEKNKNSKLYKTLGVTVGLGAVIVLI